MMRIESGPTTERKIRSTLLLLMIVVFAGWFAYDGWIGWPAQNLKEFLQQIPTEERPKAAQGRIYPSVTETSVAAAQDALKQIGVAAQRAALEKIYGGPPSYENATSWHYFGSFYRVSVQLQNGAPPEVIGRRGQRGASDLTWQKALAVVLGLFAVYLASFVLRVRGTRLLLDEAGLVYRAQGPIRWEDMKALDASYFAKKGWVHLVYDDHGAQRSLKLDEYHLARFDDVIDELCRRKGFENPLPVKPDAERENQSV